MLPAPATIEVQPSVQVSVSAAMGDQVKSESVQNINVVNDLFNVSCSAETRVNSVLSDQAIPMSCAV